MDFKQFYKIMVENHGEDNNLGEVLLKKQQKLKRIVSQQHNYERQHSQEFDEYVKSEIHAYTDFINANIDEILKNKTLKQMYQTFRDTFFKNF